jgi:hypothetical protein
MNCKMMILMIMPFPHSVYTGYHRQDSDFFSTLEKYLKSYQTTNVELTINKKKL